MKVAPVKLLSAGGYVAINYFHNRQATEDIDYIIDPRIKNLDKIKGKLQRAIAIVATAQGLPPEWINSRMEIYAVGQTKMSLFEDSVRQNTVLWRGKNLVIYAAKWEWSLAGKVKRLGSQCRDVDLSDAVAILHTMVNQNGAPLRRVTMKAWDRIVYTPIEDSALDRVASAYEAKYGRQGII